MRRFLVLLPLAALPSTALAQQDPHPIIRPMGFGDVSYVARDNGTDGFFIGQVVGQITGSLSDRLTVFTEASATAHATEYGFEIERMIIRYDFCDYIKVSAGRYHTPISYWNTAYHHGLWLQTSVDRPEMIRFGSRLIPVHFVGLQMEGTLMPATTALSYSVGIGNGRGTSIARAGDAGDANGERALAMAIAARPPALVGLQIGGGFYVDRIGQDDGEADIRERIASAHLALIRTGPELIAEYASIWHAPDEPGADYARSGAWYVQAAYRLTGGNTVKPYARYEKIAPSADDAFITGLGLDYRAYVVGARYDFAPLASLKAEYKNTRYTGADSSGSLYIQVSFAASGVGGAAM